MVNSSEVLIKVVIGNKPKMLSGLNQKVLWSGAEACHSPAADHARTTGREARPNPRNDREGE